MSSSTSLEPSNLMSPERKRTYEMEHDGPTFIGFSEGELEESSSHHLAPGGVVTPSTPMSVKKAPKAEHPTPPAPIPELPKLGEDTVCTAVI